MKTKPSTIDLASKHLGNGSPMGSSARVCLADAVRHHDAGNLKQAELWALKALAYSIGIGGDYRQAWFNVFGDTPVRWPTAADFMDARDADKSVAA